MCFYSFQYYEDVLPQYSPPGSFKGGDLNFRPTSLTLTPNEIREMQEIVDDMDVEDQNEKNRLKATLAMMHGKMFWHVVFGHMLKFYDVDEYIIHILNNITYFRFERRSK